MSDAERPSARKAQHARGDRFRPRPHPALVASVPALHHGGTLARARFQQRIAGRAGGANDQFACWPQPLDDEFKRHYGLTPNAEHFANAKYETVSAGRRLRRDFNIASNKRVAFRAPAFSALSDEEAAVLRILLNAERLDLTPSYEPPKGTPDALTPLGRTFPAARRLDRPRRRAAAPWQGDREGGSGIGNGAKEIGEPEFRRQRAGRSRR